jgi:hypothetical protein
MLDRSDTELRLRRILDATTPRGPLGVGFRMAAPCATLAVAVALAFTPAARAGANEPGPARRLTLFLGLPQVEADLPPALAEDPIDASLVAREVQRHVGDLEQCYARRLRLRPELSGTVVIRWTITAGMVFEQSVLSDTLRDGEVLTCVMDLLHEARFPVSAGGPVEVTLPFGFGRPPPGPGC